MKYKISFQTQERNAISFLTGKRYLLHIKYGLDGAGSQLIIRGKAAKALEDAGHPLSSLIHMAYQPLSITDMVIYYLSIKNAF